MVGRGAGDKGARAGGGCEVGFPLCSGAVPLFIRGGVRSQVDGAEALRIGSKLTLFPLNMCSPLCQHWHPCHRGEQCWSKRGPCRLQACDQSGATAGQPQNSGGLQCAPCAGVIGSGSPCSIWVSLVHRSNQPPLPPVCGGVMPQGRWGPGGSRSALGMGCGGLAAVRDQDHPWCTARVNTSFGCPCPCR